MDWRNSWLQADYDAVVHALSPQLEHAPQDLHIRSVLIEANIKVFNIDKAKSLMAEIQDESVSHIGLLVAQAKLLRECLDAPEASQCLLEQCAGIDCSDSYSHAKRATALYELERYDDSLDAIEKAIRLDPGAHDAYLYKGITLTRLKRYEDALKSFETAMALEHASYEAHLYKAHTLIEWNRNLKGFGRKRRDKLLQASRELDQAITINPFYYRAYFVRSRVHRSSQLLELKDRSISDFEKAISLLPPLHFKCDTKTLQGLHRDAYYLLVEASRTVPAGIAFKTFKAVSKCCDILISNTSGNPHYAVTQAIAFYRQGHLKHAEIAINNAIKSIPPNDSRFLLSVLKIKGRILVKGKRLDDATDVFNEVLKGSESNKDGYAFYELGLINFFRGRYHVSLGYLTLAIECYPEPAPGKTISALGVESWRYLLETKAQFLNQKGFVHSYERKHEQDEEAMQCYDQAIKLASRTPGLRLNRGDTYMRLGKYSQALREYAIALNYDKFNSSKIKRSMSHAFHKLARYDDAEGIVGSPGLSILAQIDLYNTIGKLRIDEKNQLEALSSLRKAKDLAKNQFQSRDIRAVPSKQLDATMVETYRLESRALRLRPDRRYSDALRALDEALARVPRQDIAKKKPQLLQEKAQILKILKDFPQAIKTIDQALSTCAPYLESVLQIERALILYEMNRDFPGAHRALKRIKEHLEKAANNPQSLYKRAQISFEIGKLAYWSVFNRPRGFQNSGQVLTDEAKRKRLQIAIDEFENTRKLYDQYELQAGTDDYKQYARKKLFALSYLERIHDSCGKENVVREICHQAEELRDALIHSTDQIKNERFDACLDSDDTFYGDLETIQDLLQQGQSREALVLAETRRNICHSWLQFSKQSPSASTIIKTVVDAIPENTCIIYWHVSPLQLSTWVLKKDISTITYVQPVDVKHQRKFFKFYQSWQRDYQQIGKGGTHEDFENWINQLPSRIKRLGSLLNVDEIKKHLSEVKHIILVPHKQLNAFPLHAIFSDSKDCHYRFSYAPDLSFISQIDFKSFGQSSMPQRFSSYLLIETSSYDLVHTEIESRCLRILLQGLDAKILPASQATPATVKKELKEGGKSIVHYTGHAVFDDSSPLDSALCLDENAMLTLREITQIGRINSELLVLAACETGLTRETTTTEEYVGLISGFLSLGVKSVISSLWPIRDKASSLFLIRFYYLLVRGYSPRNALHGASAWLKTLSYKKLLRIYRVLYSRLLAQAGSAVDTTPSLLNIKCLLQHLSLEIDSLSKLDNLGHTPYSNPYYHQAFILTGY